jgi:hypothetical protein
MKVLSTSLSAPKRTYRLTQDINRTLLKIQTLWPGEPEVPILERLVNELESEFPLIKTKLRVNSIIIIMISKSKFQCRS